MPRLPEIPPARPHLLQWALPAALAFALAFAPPAQSADAPGAPSVTATADAGALVLTWTPPADDGDAEITAYKVRWAVASGDDWQPDDDGMDAPGGGSARVYRIAGLTDGAAYKAQVAAVNSEGPGAWSAAASGTPGGICGRAPQVHAEIVRGLKLLEELQEDDTCGDVTAAHLLALGDWTLDVSLLGGIPMPLSLRREDFAGLSNLTGMFLNGNMLASVTEDVFDDLAALRVLFVKENPLSSLPAGVFGKLASLSTLDLRANRLTALPAGIFDANVRLSALHLSNNRLSTLPDGIFARLPMLRQLNLSGNPFTAPLPPGVFEGVNDALRSELGIPGEPRNVAVTSGGKRLTATWLAPLQSGIRNYLVRWKLESEAAFAAEDIATVAAPAARYVITALDAGATYQVQVAAGNSFAYGRYAAADGATRGEDAQDGAPGAPRDLRVNPGDSALALAWTPPADDGGAEISAYKVRWADAAASAEYLNAGAAEGMDVPGGASALQYRIAGLTNGGTYLAEVAAVNTHGAGVWSAAVSEESGRGICDRTRQVREAIAAALQSAGALLESETCADVTGADLAVPAQLDLSGADLPALQAGDFAGLSALAQLDLQSNRLAELPEGVFAGLSALTRLDLYSNRLAELPQGVFAGLSALTQLGLQSNQLAELPQDVFAGLSALTRLGLQSNQLAELPERVFAGLSALTLLSLQGNRLSTLPVGVFSGRFTAFTGPTALDVLHLNHNQLTELPEDVFAGLSALTALYLQFNQLSALPENVFAGAVGMKVLELSRNQLTELPEALFARVPGLTEVSFEGNRLSTLPAHIFAAQRAASATSTVQSLRLGGNRFASRLPPGVFTGFADRLLAELGVPSRPRNVAATIGNERLGVTWIAPLRTGGGITAYHLRWKLQSALQFAAADSSDLTAVSTGGLINGLLGEAYEAQIAAADAFAYGDYVTVTGTPRGPGGDSGQQIVINRPSAPRNLRATPGSGALALIWTAPADDGGADITKYKVRWSNITAPANYLNTGATAGLDAPGGASAFRYRITGLTNGATYSAQVAAVNSAGAGLFIAGRFIPDANRLNVDGNEVTDSTDGVLIARYLLGLRGAALLAGLKDSDIDERGIIENIRAVKASGDLDVNGDNRTTAADGIMIARHLLGVSGAALIAGQAAGGSMSASDVMDAIGNLRTTP